MAETLSYALAEMKPQTEVGRLMELGRWAHRVFFARTYMNCNSFSYMNSVSQDAVESMSRKINRNLVQGGEVVIFDFPEDGRFTSRVQVLTRSIYIRQMDNGPFPLKAVKTGDFSVWFAPWDLDTGALCVEIDDNLTNEPTYLTTWDKASNPNQRFAILTHKGKDPRVGPKWNVVLDFNLPDEGIKPAWRVNKEFTTS